MYRILIVDDAPANISMLNESLKSDYKLSAAGNGKEALKILEKVKPDLILLDVVMPIMDGYQATMAIREGLAGQENQTIPIIALTANAMRGDKDKCLNAGMNDYLSKPLDGPAMHAKLQQWLSAK